MNIKPGTIGVDTNDDSGRLLLVTHTSVNYCGQELLRCRHLDAEVYEVKAAAHFWPLISKLNIGE